MFLRFFLLLRKHGLPVSLKEYLYLLEAVEKPEVGPLSIEELYYLSRTILIKHEKFLDKYDQLFGHYFRQAEALPDELVLNLPEDWLRKNMELWLTEEEKKLVEAMGGLDKLMERFRQLLEEQKGRHEGGQKWIGTGGRSPFGANGFNPEGFRVGQDGGRNRSAVKVWDKREFRNLDDNVELNTRTLKMAMRRLRILTRQGMDEELDLPTTIRKTGENAGMLDIRMQPSKRNRVKVLMLMDIGGSMDDHIRQCEELFSAARHQFGQLQYYYFHNCLYESVWKDNLRRHSERITTYELLAKYNREWRVILVGDAAMGPYEITFAGGSVEHSNPEPGALWMQRLVQHFPHLVWLNPLPITEWPYFKSVTIMRELVGTDRMFPLTLDGLTNAMKELKRVQPRVPVPQL